MVIRVQKKEAQTTLWIVKITFVLYMCNLSMKIRQKVVILQKIGCGSAIQASLIAFALHNFCRKLAAAQQFKQA